MEVIGHGHTPPLSSGCGVLSLPAELAMCPCMSHKPLAAVSSIAAWTTYHLTQGTTPSSSSSLVCWMTDITTCISQHKPVAYLHTSLDATQTHPHTHTHECTHMLPSTPEAYQITLTLQSPLWGSYSLLFLLLLYLCMPDLNNNYVTCMEKSP